MAAAIWFPASTFGFKIFSSLRTCICPCSSQSVDKRPSCGNFGAATLRRQWTSCLCLALPVKRFLCLTCPCVNVLQISSKSVDEWPSCNIWRFSEDGSGQQRPSYFRYRNSSFEICVLVLSLCTCFFSSDYVRFDRVIPVFVHFHL